MLFEPKTYSNIKHFQVMQQPGSKCYCKWVKQTIDMELLAQNKGHAWKNFKFHKYNAYDPITTHIIVKGILALGTITKAPWFSYKWY